MHTRQRPKENRESADRGLRYPQFWWKRLWDDPFDCLRGRQIFFYVRAQMKRITGFAIIGAAFTRIDKCFVARAACVSVRCHAPSCLDGNNWDKCMRLRRCACRIDISADIGNARKILALARLSSQKWLKTRVDRRSSSNYPAGGLSARSNSRARKVAVSDARRPQVRPI